MAIDWSSMTDEEIQAELDAGNVEVGKRRNLQAIPEQINVMNRAYLSTEGVVEGQEWRLPGGAFDAYPLGWQVTHNETLWHSLISGNVYEPGVSGWRQVVGEGEYLEWVQPSGAHDAYAEGEEVTHDDSHWRSDTDGNVWEPPNQWTEFDPDGPPTEPEPDIPAWVQPGGSEDAYGLGDQVTHAGNLWTSQVDGNVWEPPTQWTDEGPYNQS